ncbi:MAG: O-antigen ligase family protein, partial [Gemmatimonadetes bacterium]|nr:O-antigen ligase family protein [Gemmatimonadota bacterium]
SQFGEGIPFGDAVPRAGNDSGGGQPGRILKCKGWETDPNASIYFITQAPVWEKICDVIGKPEWKTDPNYAKPEARLPRLNRRILLLVALLTVGVAWTYRYMAAGGKTTTLARFAVLLEAGRGKSASERLEYQSLANSLWQERPVTGHGFGSWSALVGSPIAADHPHNIVLEIAVELGVVGLLVFAALLVSCWIAFRSPVPLRADPLRTLALMLVVNAAVNAQFSGNLLDNRTLFAFLGLMCTPAVAQAAHTRRRSAARGPNWPSPSQPGLHSPAGSARH